MNGHIRILLVEDNAADADLLREYLPDEGECSTFELEHVETLAEGLERLSEGEIDAVLLDLNLPDSQGIETFLQMYEECPTMAIIVLTGLDDEDVAVEATGSGAEDYLCKSDLDRRLLTRSIRYAIERKRAESELRQSERRFRELADLLPQTVFEIDLEGRFTFANRAGFELTGYTQEDLDNGLNALDLFIQEDRPMVLQNIAGLVSGQASGGNEYTGVRKDGSTYPVLVFSSPIERNGKVAGLRGIVFDLTQQKQAEEDRRRMDEQLQLAGRLAAIGQLAAGVAHELNNPLTAVQGLAELMASSEGLDQSMKEDLESILREAKRASKTTTNLLSFCRKHNPDKKSICMNEVVDRSVELHAYRMRVNNIQVRLELAEELPETMADFHQMQRVLVNLITNAEQAMTDAHGEGTLTIRSSSNQDSIRLEVSDTGPGIPADQTKNIFEPFFTTKEVGKGTGLGLGICRGIVEDHGGRLDVRSRTGRGTTFIVELPIATEESQADQAAAGQQS